MDGRSFSGFAASTGWSPQRVGALEASYLKRGRPLGEARLLFEIGAEGARICARCAIGLASIPAT